MATLSYNETHSQQIRLRHIFFPGFYGLAGEIVVAIVALVLFNLNSLSDQILAQNFNDNPLGLWSQLLRKLLDSGQDHQIVQQLFLFLLWAMVGALIYVLLFRALQTFTAVRRSVGAGVGLMQRDHASGALRWLASLHDFFIKLIIIILGGVALIVGALICFGIASQELNIGLVRNFPNSLWPMLLSLLAALLSVRLIAMGLALLSRHFRAWYTA